VHKTKQTRSSLLFFQTTHQQIPSCHKRAFLILAQTQTKKVSENRLNTFDIMIYYESTFLTPIEIHNNVSHIRLLPRFHSWSNH